MPKQRYQILLVEQETDGLTLIDEILNSIGYRTFKVGDEQSAIHSCKRHNFDLALVQVELRDPGTFDIIDHMHEVQPDLDVMIVAGYFYDGIEEKIEGHHVVDFVHMPLKVGGFIQKVNGYFARQQS